MTVTTALVAIPVLAQQATPPGLVPTTAGNPNLSVAAVKAENGVRASKIIGLSVYGDGPDRIASVDDLIMTNGATVTLAVLSVGGVLGVGGKRVAVPFAQLQHGPDKMTLPGATVASLNAMPNFEY